MNTKNLKKLEQNDKTANVESKLIKALASVAEMNLKGIIAPERAKDGGYVVMWRNRTHKLTAYNLLASSGADEKVLKAIAGIHAEGKAALICRVLSVATKGKLYTPRGVEEIAERYLIDLKRSDYNATWHNLLVRSDVDYRLRVATDAATKAEKRAETARDTAKTAEKTAVQMAEIKAEAIRDVCTATAYAAAERGAEIAEMQEEVEDVDVA